MNQDTNKEHWSLDALNSEQDILYLEQISKEELPRVSAFMGATRGLRKATLIKISERGTENYTVICVGYAVNDFKIIPHVSSVDPSLEHIITYDGEIVFVISWTDEISNKSKIWDFFCSPDVDLAKVWPNRRQLPLENSDIEST